MVETIASDLGASVVRRALDANVSGMLTRRQESSVIGVNSWHPMTRQRFTIAHEIGYLVLHPKRQRFVDEVVVNYRDEQSRAGTHRQEIEANAFAAELLMPKELVMREVDRLSPHTSGEDS